MVFMGHGTVIVGILEHTFSLSLLDFNINNGVHFPRVYALRREEEREGERKRWFSDVCRGRGGEGGREID